MDRNQFKSHILVIVILFAVFWLPLGCDVKPADSTSSLRSGRETPAEYLGGPMPLKEARQMAERCSEGFVNDSSDDKKLQAAFEDTIICMLAHRDAAQRRQAAEELGAYRKACAVDALLLAAEDDSPAVRSAAIRAVGWIDAKNAALPITAHLKDSDPDVRKTSAEVLGRLANPAACDTLIVSLKDSAPAVRAASAGALGWCRDSKALQPLVTALKDNSPKVRSAAAGALGLLGQAGQAESHPAIPALISALQDKDAMVRYMSAGALGKLGDRQAVAPLQALRDDPDLAVRNQAEAALRKLNR